MNQTPITNEAIKRAVAEMSLLRFFPSDPGARAAVMGLLSRMVETNEQLAWLVRVMVDEVGTWGGSTELRGVFCSRFRPKDGQEANCSTTAGFTPDDLETRAITEHDSAKRLGAGAGVKLLPAAKPIQPNIACRTCLDTGRIFSAGRWIACSCDVGATQVSAVDAENEKRGVKEAYRCRLCGSRKQGEGLLLVGNRVEFCACCSEGYKARVDLAALNRAGSTRERVSA